MQNQIKTIRYCLISAYLGGINLHPRKQVEKLGMLVHNYEGCPIADCVFMEVSNIPDILPNYIEISNYKLQ